MGRLFSIEEVKPSESLFLFYGDASHPLFYTFLKKIKENISLVFLSNKRVSFFESPLKSYFVNLSDVKLLGHIKEKFNYSLFFLGESGDVNYLEKMMPKLVKDESKTFVVFNIRDYKTFSDILIEYKRYKNIYFAIIGDLYGPSVPKSLSPVSYLMHACFGDKNIDVKHGSLDNIFPFFFEDALKGFNLLFFGSRTQSRVNLLFYESPLTYISAVHLIKRVEPELGVDFLEEGTLSHKGFELDSFFWDVEKKVSQVPSFFVDSIYGFEKSLFKYAEFFSDLKPERKRLRNKSSTFKSVLLILLSSFLVFIFANLIILALLVLSTVSLLDQAKRSNFSTISSNSKRIIFLHSLVEPQLSLATSFIPSENIRAKYPLLKEGISKVSYVSELLASFKITEGFSEKKKLGQLIEQLNDFYFFDQRLNLLDIRLEFLPDVKSSYFSVLQVMPHIFGYDGEKRYLVLFQNNAELRPTGGFIGSLADLKIKNGTISNFEIFDVYDIDGQLKAHVEPPFIVKRYLQPHLYLRDSNFSLDFESSASSSALLYRLSTGKKVDGVIALDYEVLRRIVLAIGPIYVGSSLEALDGNELYDYIQNSIDSNFFPGSIKKREVLNSIYSKLMLRFSDEPKSIYKAALLFPNLISQKHVLFAFNDRSLQQVFSANGFSSSLRDYRESDKFSVNDFLAISEANIGVNKANTGVTRSVLYEATLKGNNVESKVTLSIFNSNKKGEIYKCYLRIAVPIGSKLKRITINDVKQRIVKAITDAEFYNKKNFRPPNGLEVDVSDDNKLSVFGFLVEVPNNISSRIELVYGNSILTPESPYFSYNLFYFKQPGTLEYPLRFSFHHDGSYKPQGVNRGKVSNNQLVFDSIVNSDIFHNFSLSR